MTPSIQFQRAMREAKHLHRQLAREAGYVPGKVTKPSWDLLRAPLPQVQSRFDRH